MVFVKFNHFLLVESNKEGMYQFKAKTDSNVLYVMYSRINVFQSLSRFNFSEYARIRANGKLFKVMENINQSGFENIPYANEVYP